MSQQRFDEAIRLEEGGQTEAALVIWQELATSNPTRNVYLRLAGCSNRLGLAERARDAFERALAVDPFSVRALAGLGILAIERRDYTEAERHFRQACSVEQDPGTLTLLGVALSNLGEDAEAEATYRKAINLDPCYEEAYFNLAVLVCQERPTEALAFFKKALELDPGYAVAEVQLNLLQQRLHPLHQS